MGGIFFCFILMNNEIRIWEWVKFLYMYIGVVFLGFFIFFLEYNLF